MIKKTSYDKFRIKNVYNLRNYAKIILNKFFQAMKHRKFNNISSLVSSKLSLKTN